MSGSSDLGEIKEIGSDAVSKLIEQMDCLVDLLPEFRMKVLTSARKGTQHLLALTQPGEANPSGVILYGVKEGRRDTTTLDCQLLLVSGQMKTDVGQALIRHVINEHNPHRVEAKVTNSDPSVDL